MTAHEVDLHRLATLAQVGNVERTNRPEPLLGSRLVCVVTQGKSRDQGVGGIAYLWTVDHAISIEHDLASTSSDRDAQPSRPRPTVGYVKFDLAQGPRWHRPFLPCRPTRLDLESSHLRRRARDRAEESISSGLNVPAREHHAVSGRREDDESVVVEEIHGVLLE